MSSSIRSLTASKSSSATGIERPGTSNVLHMFVSSDIPPGASCGLLATPWISLACLIILSRSDTTDVAGTCRALASCCRLLITLLCRLAGASSNFSTVSQAVRSSCMLDACLTSRCGRINSCRDCGIPAICAPPLLYTSGCLYPAVPSVPSSGVPLHSSPTAGVYDSNPCLSSTVPGSVYTVTPQIPCAVHPGA
jgi:hypothetical protein